MPMNAVWSGSSRPVALGQEGREAGLVLRARPEGVADGRGAAPSLG
jgi:hypothetical protein